MAATRQDPVGHWCWLLSPAWPVVVVTRHTATLCPPPPMSFTAAAVDYAYDRDRYDADDCSSDWDSVGNCGGFRFCADCGCPRSELHCLLPGAWCPHTTRTSSLPPGMPKSSVCCPITHWVCAAAVAALAGDGSASPKPNATARVSTKKAVAAAAALAPKVAGVQKVKAEGEGLAAGGYPPPPSPY